MHINTSAIFGSNLLIPLDITLLLAKSFKKMTLTRIRNTRTTRTNCKMRSRQLKTTGPITKDEDNKSKKASGFKISPLQGLGENSPIKICYQIKHRTNKFIN